MKKNIFEINDLSNIKIFDCDGIKIYYMDNFYRYPDDVYNYITSIYPPLWKQKEENSFNNIYFEDRRHYIKDKRIEKTVNSLSKLINKNPSYPDIVMTNFTRFKKDKFNDYENNLWWPHTDDGYNAIIYLNKDILEEHNGTSIYLKINEKSIDGTEHSQPWQKRENWKTIVEIQAYYNRLVIFDGNYYHAMNISDDKFFGDSLDDAKFRINQVIFFD